MTDQAQRTEKPVFHIEQPPDRNHRLALQCKHGVDGFCRFGLWNKPAMGVMWHWDGNVEAPTITPSIDCHGGCGRHFTMVKGEFR